MKILVSTYACEPNKGSESSVGWNISIEISKNNYEVWVLTRSNNKTPIDNELNNIDVQKNLHFIYYDLPIWLQILKKGYIGTILYYYLWQWGAYKIAKKNHLKIKFDMVHHITFVSIRQPSFMGLLGIPFIFGPVAGGEYAPFALRKGYGIKGQIKDFVRDISNYLIKFDPFMHHTFSSANKLLVTSEQSKSIIPKCYHNKTNINLAIGINTNNVKRRRNENDISRIKLLYIGRILYWKGMCLGLKAFAEAIKLVPNIQLTIVGEGPDENNWRNLCNKYNIQDHIEWLPWIENKKIENIYINHDILLFPSLHDSGGIVVLEAMSYGLPAICLDIGGPGLIVNNSCGRNILVHGRSYNEVIRSLCDAIIELASKPHIYTKLSKECYKRVEMFGWDRLVKKIYYH